MTKQEFKQALADILRDDTIQIYGGNDESPFVAQTFTIDLSTARDISNPYVIGFPFKTISIKGAATDSTSTVNLITNKNDSGISAIPLIVNDVLNTNTIVSKGFLSWSAQSGKTITVTVFLHANYSSGSLVNSGSSTIRPSVNSVVNIGASGTLAAASVCNLVVPANCVFKGNLSFNGPVITLTFMNASLRQGAGPLVSCSVYNPTAGAPFMSNSVYVELGAGTYTWYNDQAYSATGYTAINGVIYNTN